MSVVTKLCVVRWLGRNCVVELCSTLAGTSPSVPVDMPRCWETRVYYTHLAQGVIRFTTA